MRENVYSIEDIENMLIVRYRRIPMDDLKAYEWLKEQTGVNDKNIAYRERFERHEKICRILGISPQSGIAGRDFNEY